MNLNIHKVLTLPLVTNPNLGLLSCDAHTKNVKISGPEWFANHSEIKQASYESNLHRIKLGTFKVPSKSTIFVYIQCRMFLNLPIFVEPTIISCEHPKYVTVLLKFTLRYKYKCSEKNLKKESHINM